MITSRQLRRLLDRRGLLAWTAAAVAGLALLLSGAGAGLDDRLRDARDELRMRPASGEVVIVEIDGSSLGRYDNWPWPRRHHAALVDRLSAAQARVIAFDVDFSARSSLEDDAALAAALDRAGGQVVLPTFRQAASRGSAEQVESLPAELFRDRAFLAGVNVVPEQGGQVRAMPLGTHTGGLSRPSLAAMVAEYGGAADGMVLIDYSIDPATIPSFSFVDVVEGRVPAAALTGKRVLVGATSIDLGDRYAVPVHGVIPGVVIQALAAETLLAGQLPGTASGAWPLLLALLAAGCGLAVRRRATRGILFVGGILAVAALPLIGEHWAAIGFPVAPALAALATALVCSGGLDLAARFRRQGLVDPDTGLANLRALEGALMETGSARVVVARIDRFAEIASALGPATTVKLIHRIVDRLGFEGGFAVHRIDEGHLAWIERGTGEVELEHRLLGLLALMRAPVDCGRLVDVSLSFGIAAAGSAAAKQQIANAALAALNAARGARRLGIFSEAGADEADWRLSLLAELGSAMASGHVWNAYQPKFDFRTGNIVGVETLVRWSHPERGLVGPDQFIPMVEEHGRAADLTAHVFRQALKDLSRWHAAGHDLSVAVNVSATLLDDRAFRIWLGETLRSAKVRPERVIVEVTESAAMQDATAAVQALAEWRALGVGISIDDYGTGQSSLAYLQRLPATELKIDKSFILRLTEDSRDAIMVASTIALAHQLGMKVVAEGVETKACLDQLGEMGCDVAQGWHIGRPVPAADLEATLAAKAPLAA